MCGGRVLLDSTKLNDHIDIDVAREVDRVKEEGEIVCERETMREREREREKERERVRVRVREKETIDFHFVQSRQTHKV